MGTAHLVTETEQALPRTTRQPLFLPGDAQKIHARENLFIILMADPGKNIALQWFSYNQKNAEK